MRLPIDSNPSLYSVGRVRPGGYPSSLWKKSHVTDGANPGLY